MNATAEQITPDLQQQLDAAYERRAACREAVIHARATVARGEESLAAANEELQRRQAEKSSWKQRHAERTKEWLTAGNAGAPPQLVVDADAESKLTRSQLNAESINAALTSLQAQAACAESALTRAEAAVVALVDEILGRDAERLADEILQHGEQIRALGRQLRAVRPSGIHTPVNLLHGADDLHVPINRLPSSMLARPMSGTIDRALEVLEKLTDLRDLHIPVNQLKGFAVDNGDEARAFAARRQALIAGPTEQT